MRVRTRGTVTRWIGSARFTTNTLMGSHFLIDQANRWIANGVATGGTVTRTVRSTSRTGDTGVRHYVVVRQAKCWVAHGVATGGTISRNVQSTSRTIDTGIGHHLLVRQTQASCFTMVTFPPLRTRAVASLVRLTHYRPSRSATVLTRLAVFAHAAWNGLANRCIVPLPQSTRGDTGRLVP